MSSHQGHHDHGAGAGDSSQSFRPSAFGFRSIKPSTREDRRNKKDKVALEKSRINQRTGWQARMHQLNAPAHSSGLTSCEENAVGYISNADRFHSDTAGEQLEIRQEEARKRQHALEYRKLKQQSREEERWTKMEEEQRQKEEYWHKVREDGSHAKKNQSMVAYDITNLQYFQNVSGEDQKYVDDMVRFRAQARTRNLVILGDSRAPYNIISGGPRVLPAAPTEVKRPEGPRTMEQLAIVDRRKAL